MSQHIPGVEEEALPFPDFHEEIDLFTHDSVSSKLYLRRRRMLIIVSIVMLALLLGTVLVVVVKRRSHIIYQAQSVVQGDLALTLNATGPLRVNAYSMNFTGSGKVVEIDVKVGQQVKKDQILAKLDTTVLQNALNEAQDNVDAAQTTLATAKANYDATLSATNAKVNAAQAALNTVTATHGQADGVSIPGTTPARSDTVRQRLVDTQAQQTAQTTTTQGQINTAKQQLVDAQAQQTVQTTSAQGQINTAQAALTTAQAQLTTAKYNLDNTVLKAPHNGTVATVDAMIGGVPGNPLIQIMDLSSAQIQVNVDESHISAVAVGDRVKFSLNAYRDQSFEGKVAAISPLGQSTASVTTYPVLIDIITALPATTQLLPGMSAQATITTNNRPDALLIPNSALNFARSAINSHVETDRLINRTQVDEALRQANDMLQNLQQDVSNEHPTPAFVLERSSQGKIVIKPIVTGLTDGKVYEVLDGLSTDDVVLIGARNGSD